MPQNGLHAEHKVKVQWGTPPVFGSSVDSQGWKCAQKSYSAFRSHQQASKDFLVRPACYLQSSERECCPKYWKSWSTSGTRKSTETRWNVSEFLSVRRGVEEGIWSGWSWQIWRWSAGWGLSAEMNPWLFCDFFLNWNSVAQNRPYCVCFFILCLVINAIKILPVDSRKQLCFCSYLLHTRVHRIGICEYGYGYGYGCDISYPRQPR